MGSLVESLLGGVTFGLLGDQQRDAAKKAADTQKRAEMDARRIAAEQKPMEESATLLTDTGVNENTLGSLGLMVEPTAPKKKPTTGVGTTSSTGLATTTSTSLGFGS